MKQAILFLFFANTILSSSCLLDISNNSRSYYSIGDTLSIEDLAYDYPICNGSDGFELGDSFNFSYLDGDSNGGNYKVTLISMNATW